MNQPVEASGTYALGHAEHEQERLMKQSARIGAMTEGWLREAGLGPGMRVLDAGCGVGDVSFLAAAIVGPEGTVVGVDRSADALATARERATALGYAQVTFREADIATLEIDGEFDAVIGRLVLVHVDDPVAVVRHLAGLLRPGGLVIFHEVDLHTRAWPPAPLFERCSDWVVQAFTRSGSIPDMGLRLYKTFVDAGLPAPQIAIRGIVTSPGEIEGFQAYTRLVRSLLPAIERFQLATAAEVDIETLAERLRAEVAASGGVVATAFHYGAWTRTPAA